MYINITENAKEQLKDLENKYPKHLLFLHYEMGGCGSPLDGVLRLKLVKLNIHFERVQTNWKPLYLNKNSLFFLDSDITIDYSNGFQIKSTSQTYSTNMTVEIE